MEELGSTIVSDDANFKSWIGVKKSRASLALADLEIRSTSRTSARNTADVYLILSWMHEDVSLHKVEADQLADLKADLNHHGNAYHIKKSMTEKWCRLAKTMSCTEGWDRVARQLYTEHFHARSGLSDKAKDVESFGLTPMAAGQACRGGRGGSASLGVEAGPMFTQYWRYLF